MSTHSARDNKVQQTRVQLGQSTPGIAAIVSGLTEGQLVITEGIQRVHPGITVVPGPATPAPHTAALDVPNA